MEEELLVFVSSVTDEFLRERQAVEETINSIPLTKAWVFERAPASADPVDDTYLCKVRDCDIFVLLVGAQITQAVKNEHAEAVAHHKRRLVFLKKVHRAAETQAFIEEIGGGVKWDTFATLAELCLAVREAVRDELINGYGRFGLKAREVSRLRADLSSMLQERYGELENNLADACYCTVAEGARSLLQLLEAWEDHSQDDLRSNCHLLLAQAALYTQRSPDIVTAREHLAGAVGAEGDQTRVKREIVEALIEYGEGDVDDAVTRLVSLDSPRAARVEFIIRLARGELDECKKIIAEQDFGLDQGKGSIEWEPYLAWFELRAGNQGQALARIGELLRQSPSGRVLEVAGHMYLDLANQRVNQFLREHDLVGTFTMWLDLSPLVDSRALKEAAQLYHRAAEFYRSRWETATELLNLERAAYIAIPSESLLGDTATSQICDRLAQIDEDNILLRLSRQQAGDAEGSPPGPTARDVEKQLERGAPPHLICQWLDASIDAPDAPLEDYAQVAEEHLPQLTLVEHTALWTWTASELLGRSGDEKSSLRVLDSFAPPERFAYLKPLMRATRSHLAGQSQEAESSLEAAVGMAPDNPLVLAFSTRFYASGELSDKAEEACNRLLDKLATAQTYEWNLDILLGQGKWMQFLDVLQRASAAGIMVGERYDVLYRARALVQLRRSEDARDLLETAYQSGLLEPIDLVNLALLRYHQGDRAKGLAAARELVDNQPGFDQAHLLLSQLLVLDNQHDEAFRVAAGAAKRFPESEELQLNALLIGYRSGHEDNGALNTGYILESLSGRGLVWKVSLEEVKDLIGRHISAAQDADRSYRGGVLPIMFLSYAPGFNCAYFELWHRATRHGIPLYVAPGNQTGDLEQLEAIAPCAVVLDYPALLTAWGLWRDRCLKQLAKLFTQVCLPSSFRDVLAGERTKLAQFGQPAFKRSLKKIEELVEAQDERFVMIDHAATDDDPFGIRSNLDYALENDLLYLSEGLPYLGEPYDQAGRVALRDVAELLFAQGYIDESGRATLLEVCAPEGPSTADLSALDERREIAADLMTLRSIAQAGLLMPVVSYFKRIHISRQELDYIRATIRGHGAQEDVWQEFRAFAAMLEQKSELIQWVTPEDSGNRLPPSDTSAESPAPERDALLTYFYQLFLLSHEKACPLMTDDRATKAVQGEPHVILRFGTDTFLRLLHRKGLVDHTEFISLYGRLIDWQYRHLSPEPVFLLDVLASGTGESPRLNAAVSYYQNSIQELLQASQGAPASQRGELIQNTLRLFTDGFWTTLRHAYAAGRNSEAAARLVSRLGFPSFLEEFRARKPEYLAHLVGSVLTRPLEWLMSERNSDDRFLEWLDDVLLKAGYEPTDIDLSWRYLIEELCSSETAQLQGGRDATLVMIRRLMEALPERTIVSIASSATREFLREVGGFDIEHVHEFKVAQQGAAPTIRVTESRLQDALNFAAAQDWVPGIQEIEHEGLALKVNLAGMFAAIEILPSDPAFQSQRGHGVRRVAHLIHWFPMPDPMMRLHAWRAGRKMLLELHASTATWDHLAADLQSGEEDTYRHAGEACVDVLAGDRRIYESMLRDATSADVGAVLAAIGILNPAHVAGWLGMEVGNLKSKDALSAWCARQLDKVRECLQESQPSPKLGSQDCRPIVRVWLDSVQLNMQSMFGDARLFRESLVSLLQVYCEQEGVGEAIGFLLDAGETRSSRAFKGNILMTILELVPSAESRLWSIIDENTGSTLAQRTARLLEAIISATGDVDAQDDASSELAFIAGLCSFALHERWLATEKRSASVESLRYLSTIAGGAIADCLAETGPLQLAEARHTLATAFLAAAHAPRAGAAAQEPWDKRGFYRAEWSRYFDYPLAFIMPQLRAHLPTLSTHLLTEPTRRHMLNIAVRHRLHHFFLADHLELTWLDSAFDTTPASGVDELLRASYGEALDEWPETEQAQLASIELFDDPDAVLDLMFEHVAGGADDALILLYLRLFSIASVYASDRWVTAVSRWLDPRTLERLQTSEELYSALLELASMVVLKAPPGHETTAAFRSLLVSTTEQGTAQHLLTQHAWTLARLATLGWKSDPIAGWLQKISRDEQVDLSVRRECIRTFTESWDGLPASSREQLAPVLMELAASYPFAGFLELRRFRTARDRGPEGTDT